MQAVSGNTSASDKHRSRFQKWQRLTGPETRYLSSRVEAALVPPLEKLGFCRVDVIASDPAWTVSGREIWLERPHSEWTDSINFSFEKYGSPRVQIGAARRPNPPARDIVRDCNLVAKRSQYYHFWGKPWWLPTRFWKDRMTDRIIVEIEAVIKELIAFLESGERGRHISKKV